MIRCKTIMGEEEQNIILEMTLSGDEFKKYIKIERTLLICIAVLLWIGGLSKVIEGGIAMIIVGIFYFLLGFLC